MSVSKNRVAEIIFIRAKNSTTARYADRMLRSGTALCMDNIIVIINLIQVGTLRPMDTAQGTIPHIMNLSHQCKGIQIKLLNPNKVVTVIAAAVRIRMGPNIIAFPIIIKEQAGINAVCPLKIMRLRPWTSRVLSCNNKVTPKGYVGTDDIKSSLMVADCRCKKTSGMTCFTKRQLRCPIQYISDLFPMRQIPTVHNGQAGKISK